MPVMESLCLITDRIWISNQFALISTLFLLKRLLVIKLDSVTGHQGGSCSYPTTPLSEVYVFIYACIKIFIPHLSFGIEFQAFLQM